MEMHMQQTLMEMHMQQTLMEMHMQQTLMDMGIGGCQQLTAACGVLCQTHG